MHPELEGAFLGLHDDANDAGWCRCVAWWVPTWDGWGERTADENLALRRSLWQSGEHDGFLAFEEDVPVGWVQAGRRDRLDKLVRQLGLEPDPETWCLSCFLVAPGARGRGVAGALLDGALAALVAAGVRRVEAYPRSGRETGDDEAWTGPGRLFERAGFEVVSHGSPRSVVALRI
jgi:GNAT superfamily N-acetyltransferase